MATLLDSIPDVGDDELWYRATLLTQLQALHLHILATFVDLATGKGDRDLEPSWLETFGEELPDYSEASRAECPPDL